MSRHSESRGGRRRASKAMQIPATTADAVSDLRIEEEEEEAEIYRP